MIKIKIITPLGLYKEGEVGGVMILILIILSFPEP